MDAGDLFKDLLESLESRFDECLTRDDKIETAWLRKLAYGATWIGLLCFIFSILFMVLCVVAFILFVIDTVPLVGAVLLGIAGLIGVMYWIGSMTERGRR